MREHLSTSNREKFRETLSLAELLQWQTSYLSQITGHLAHHSQKEQGLTGKISDSMLVHGYQDAPAIAPSTPNEIELPTRRAYLIAAIKLAAVRVTLTTGARHEEKCEEDHDSCNAHPQRQMRNREKWHWEDLLGGQIPTYHSHPAFRNPSNRKTGPLVR
jgi:hypothetical protein